MADLTQVTLQLLIQKLDQILKAVNSIKLGRRSVDREEEEKTLNKHDVFSRPGNPEHSFMRKDSPPKDKEKKEKKFPYPDGLSQDQFITAMHNVMKWVNKK